MFAAVSLGTVISNVLIYYLIENVGIGLSIICSYFTEKDQVGYQYQKALGVSFLICVMMTPVLYFSDRIFAKVFGFGNEW